MTTSIVLGERLKKTAKKKGLSQKQIASASFMAYTTTNGHFNNYPVTTENAVAYSKELNDSELTFAISQEMLGLIGLANGCQIKKDTLALNAFQRREAQERKQVEIDREIAIILATEENELTEEHKENLSTHANEYVDEILFEVSQLCKELDIIGMSFMDLIKNRLPYWKSKKWIE